MPEWDWDRVGVSEMELVDDIVSLITCRRERM